MTAGFQEGRKRKFPGQLKATLRTDTVPFCCIPLVKVVTGSTWIQEYRTKFPLWMGEWQVLIQKSIWNGRYCHGHHCKIHSAVAWYIVGSIKYVCLKIISIYDSSIKHSPGFFCLWFLWSLNLAVLTVIGAEWIFKEWIHFLLLCLLIRGINKQYDVH